MKNIKSPLDLLDKFFEENSSDYIQGIIDSVENRKFNGPTVIEYFDGFHTGFEDYQAANFDKCSHALLEIWDDMLGLHKEILKVRKAIKDREHKLIQEKVFKT